MSNQQNLKGLRATDSSQETTLASLDSELNPKTNVQVRDFDTYMQANTRTPSIQEENNNLGNKIAKAVKNGQELEKMIDKFCQTKVKGNESKTFREHAKGLLEQQKKDMEELEQELTKFKAVKENNPTRKILRDGMINGLQAKWNQERDLMVKSAEKLGKMLACSSQQEAVKLWDHYQNIAQNQAEEDRQSASSDDLSQNTTVIKKKSVVKSDKKEKKKSIINGSYSTAEDRLLSQEDRSTINYERQDRKTQCCLHLIFASILLLVIIATTIFLILESKSFYSGNSKLVDTKQSDNLSDTKNSLSKSLEKVRALGDKIVDVKSSHHKHESKTKTPKKQVKKVEKKPEVKSVKKPNHEKKPDAKPMKPKPVMAVEKKHHKKPEAKVVKFKEPKYSKKRPVEKKQPPMETEFTIVYPEEPKVIDMPPVQKREHIPKPSTKKPDWHMVPKQRQAKKIKEAIPVQVIEKPRAPLPKAHYSRDDVLDNAEDDDDMDQQIKEQLRKLLDLYDVKGEQRKRKEHEQRFYKFILI